jgi:hypothetical protein
VTLSDFEGKSGAKGHFDFKQPLLFVPTISIPRGVELLLLRQCWTSSQWGLIFHFLEWKTRKESIARQSRWGGCSGSTNQLSSQGTWFVVALSVDLVGQTVLHPHNRSTSPEKLAEHFRTF